MVMSSDLPESRHMTLCSERLYLREWRDADRDSFAAMSADAAVMQYLRALPKCDLSCDSKVHLEVRPCTKCHSASLGRGASATVICNKAAARILQFPSLSA